jgi:hypothetical protein
MSRAILTHKIIEKLREGHKRRKLIFQERRILAKFSNCCYHCGATKDLLVIDTEDGQHLTLCLTAAKMREVSLAMPNPRRAVK